MLFDCCERTLDQRRFSSLLDRFASNTLSTYEINVPLFQNRTKASQDACRDEAGTFFDLVFAVLYRLKEVFDLSSADRTAPRKNCES
ncbi:hypothetical protein Plhal304r1_c025g0083941 [Plasmopara halstedii]